MKGERRRKKSLDILVHLDQGGIDDRGEGGETRFSLFFLRGPARIILKRRKVQGGRSGQISTPQLTPLTNDGGGGGARETVSRTESAKKGGRILSRISVSMRHLRKRRKRGEGEGG